MAFGPNSGVVGGGIGQGFAQGSQQIQQGVQEGLRRRDRQQEIDYQKEQDRLNRQEREKQARAAAVQTALEIRIKQFNSMTPPEIPADLTNLEDANAAIDNVIKYHTTRESSASSADSLFGVLTDGIKNPDGTPLNSTPFSEFVLGMNQTDRMKALAEKTVASNQLKAKMQQLNDKRTQLTDIMSKAGPDNDEYRRVDAEIKELEGGIAPLWEKFTGTKFVGGSTNYAKLEQAATSKRSTQVTLAALQQYATNPDVQSIITAIGDKPGVNMNTKLGDLGLPAELANFTVGQVFKLARGNENLDDALAAGDYKKSVAIYLGMSESERNENQNAMKIKEALSAGDKSNPFVSAWMSMGMDAKQSTLIDSQIIGQGLQNKNQQNVLNRTWAERADSGEADFAGSQKDYVKEKTEAGWTTEQINDGWLTLTTAHAQAVADKATRSQQGKANLTQTNINIKAATQELTASFGTYAQQGNPMVLGMKSTFENILRGVNPDITQDALDAQWDSVIQKYQTKTGSDNANYTLLQQAVKEGDLKQAGAYGQMVKDGTLFIADSAGMTGSIQQMFKDKYGKDWETRYKQEVADSRANYFNFQNGNETDLNIKRAQLTAINAENEFNELTKPDRLRLLGAQADAAQADAYVKEATKKLTVKSQQYEFFSRGAKEMGAEWLNSDKTKALAASLGVDLGQYQTTASFTDWARSNEKRSAKLDEFYKLMDNPEVMNSASPQQIRDIADTLGLDYTKLKTAISTTVANKQRMTAAQLEQVLTSTWATKEGVALDKDRLDFTKSQAIIEQNNWNETFRAGRDDEAWRRLFQEKGFSAGRDDAMQQRYQWQQNRADSNKQWGAEMNLRYQQRKDGLTQEAFSNSMRILDAIRSDQQFAQSMNATERQTMSAYAGTLTSSIQGAQAAANEFGNRVAELEKNHVVATNKNRIKLENGVYAWAGDERTMPNEVGMYIEALNGQRQSQNTANAGVANLAAIQKMFSPEANGNTAKAKEIYAAIFGENNANGTGMWDDNVGPRATLTPAYRDLVKALPGKQGDLLRAALQTLDNGLIVGGQNIGNIPDACSTTLRVLAERVGVNRALYFGSTARETYQLTSKNGISLNNGQQLKVGSAAAKNLQPGDLLYQDYAKNNVDHVAIYIGNGMVYEHNSHTTGTTGAKGGNIHVVPLDKFLKAAPVYAARIPEIGDNTRPATKNEQPGTTTSTGTKITPSYKMPTLSASSLQKNLTRVLPTDNLSFPQSNGMYARVRDQGTASFIVQSYAAQTAKAFGKSFTSLPLDKRREFLIDILSDPKGLAFQGDIRKAVMNAIKK